MPQANVNEYIAALRADLKSSPQAKKLALNLSKFDYRTAQAHAAEVEKIQKTLKIGGVTRKALDFYVFAGRKSR